ncbi:lycopene beta-cyclase CrtY [Erythrobacter rubeus]|uniref:Lycopene beta-cyclase CrtY n=1 Tax=Erythrobacter rubeus TaxID=2760803 RepID=A0ABR8KKQ6_9SPHN|nr:lycopene beta-cyclase CrtY [Erythrobacter rubeus]MBD2840878.1 lycopene beta-cyclase CrtY [Erythrobacter rubeus]
MTDSQFDIAIVGGGLAGGLIALALHQRHPGRHIALIEGGTVLGGNHRWSWFESDLDKVGKALLEPIPQTEWDKGYDVRFPKYSRTLETGYRSMSSADFHEALSAVLPEGTLQLGRRAASLDAAGVDFEDGTRIAAGTVIDCRSFTPSKHLRGGWQVFVGRHMRLPGSHGVERPVIMDADVEQVAPHGNGGAYRFVYVLPLGEKDVFVEDTYYADEPLLDRAMLSSRIDSYSHAHGWDDHAVVGHESGVLPVLTGGDFAAYQDEVRIPGVVIAGARGGFTHPLTSYTIPIAVGNALAIAEKADLPAERLAEIMESRARRHWRSTGYYRLLGRFLFFAADPDARVNVFQRFYSLRKGLIERFYAARSSRFDRVRVLWGNPPVSIFRAMTAMFKRGKPLKSEKTA